MHSSEDKKSPAPTSRWEIFGWCLYDWANSAFATTVLAAVLPIYFIYVVPKQGVRLGLPGGVGWTAPVGSYPDAPVALGLSDMAGNVWEYANDRNACDLGTDPVTDPVGPATGTGRVLRGGSWLHGDVRCALRHGHDPADPQNNHGLRVARTVSP